MITTEHENRRNSKKCAFSRIKTEVTTGIAMNIEKPLVKNNECTQ